MKKLIATAVAVMMCITAMADDYTLYIVANTTTNYTLKQVQKLTFENGNVVVNLKDGTKQTTAISAVSRIYFDLAAAYATQDVNQDGTVDTQDVLVIYEFMQNQTPESTIGTEDVNQDSAVDTQDVLNVYESIQNN